MKLEACIVFVANAGFYYYGTYDVGSDCRGYKLRNATVHKKLGCT